MMHLVIAVTDGEVTDILTDKRDELITAEVVVIDSCFGEQNAKRIESLNRNAEYARLGFETVVEQDDSNEA